MPELPEVETVRRSLAPALVGHRLARVETRRPDLRFPFPERFAERLAGARVLSLERRGKFLIAPLDTGEDWITHLGMTGAFSFIPGSNDRHVHVVITTEAGSEISYRDPRRFGFMELGPRSGHPRLAALGPDPFDDAFEEHLTTAFAGRRQTVKGLLMDQRIVAGMGNIYASEALHRARISPLRAGGRLSGARVSRLAKAVRDVLSEAIVAGGSTIRDYVSADGASGYFQHRFQVYDHKGEACPREGCAGRVRRAVIAGRATYWCPSCQT